MGTSKKKILIVEDNAVQALTLQKLFKKTGYEVVGIVKRGEKAVRKTKALQPDLIIMDIFLDGDMTGLQAMDEIRQMSDVPVIYISGNSDSYYQRLAKKTTFSEFFCKPVNHNELGVTVHHMLAGDGEVNGRPKKKAGNSIWPFSLFF